MDGIIICIILMVIIIPIIMIRSQKKVEQAVKNNAASITNFETTKEIKDPLNNFIVRFDESNEKIAYIDANGVKIIPFKDIIGVERIENGVTKYKKSIAGTVGGALIGGAVAGGAGMIVGGMTSSGEASKKLTSLSVKVIINDLSNPSINLPLPLDSALIFGLSFKVADDLIDTFKVIINRNSSTQES